MKNVPGRVRWLASLALLLALAATSCTNPVLGTESGDADSARALVGGVEVFPLVAHKKIAAGTVSVWRDAEKLYVKYETNETFTLEETHVWVGTALGGLRLRRHGYHNSGYFASGYYSPATAWDRDEIPEGSRSWTEEVAFQPEWEGKSLYIFAHAELERSNHRGREEAWGGDKVLQYRDWRHVQHWGYHKEWMRYIYATPPYINEVPTYSLAGHVFNDLDTDGYQDSTDLGLSGVTITLSKDSTVLSTVVTGADGAFSFGKLEAGTYTVSSGGLPGYSPTPYTSPITSWVMVVPPTASNLPFGLSQTSASKAIGGVAFYDSNLNNTYDSGEPLLPGVTVRIAERGLSTVTDQNGAYSFPNLESGTSYVVSADRMDGFVHSVDFERTLTTTDPSASSANFGFATDYIWLNGQTAAGKSVSYWKTNIDKAIAGTAGADVDAATLSGYVASLSGFALSPLSLSSLAQVSAALGSTAADVASLMQKELLASELNYLAGAYIGGNGPATYYFLYDGEYMLNNASSYDDVQREAQQHYYEAYNASNGGPVVFETVPQIS